MGFRILVFVCMTIVAAFATAPAAAQKAEQEIVDKARAALEKPRKDTDHPSLIAAREEWNKAYYGQAISVEDIILHNKAASPGADPLRQALAAR